ncbi:alkaline shock response membrane anchor protein AmaP [Nesterenkonia halotolerans]|uniref:Alkaline shock response membrane anchor protein AmaP n=1 Tax=Nesterenkonia halotolerans TaxID=225325 RepID=A0ABR9J9Q3_9MICC|nr:alkaline shock response membrane anchor protein AmaP [Nesterenkonia halotolerans]MBE1515730.1 hypothetical protein [Nesterenkonia halotolerans]
MIAVSKAPNRLILFLLGVVLLAAGAAVVAVALSLLTQWEQAPAPDDALGSHDALPAWLPAGVLAASVVLVLLGLWWIIAAVPRSERAGDLQLQRDGRAGVSLLSSSVLQRAIAESAEKLPGVLSATVRLEGTAKSPGLLIKVEVDERSAIRHTVEQLHRQTCAEVEQSLQAKLTGVRVIVDPVRRSARSHEAELQLT